MEGKTIHYFLVIVNFIKNGNDPIVEKHGIKGSQPIPEDDYAKLQDNIKVMRKRNYPTDSISPLVLLPPESITKEQYESLPLYAQH